MPLRCARQLHDFPAEDLRDNLEHIGLFSTMSIIRPFGAEDLLKINAVNIDAWTETVSPHSGCTPCP